MPSFPSLWLSEAASFDVQSLLMMCLVSEYMWKNEIKWTEKITLFWTIKECWAGYTHSQLRSWHTGIKDSVLFNKVWFFETWVHTFVVFAFYLFIVVICWPLLSICLQLKTSPSGCMQKKGRRWVRWGELREINLVSVTQKQENPCKWYIVEWFGSQHHNPFFSLLLPHLGQA